MSQLSSDQRYNSAIGANRYPSPPPPPRRPSSAEPVGVAPHHSSTPPPLPVDIPRRASMEVTPFASQVVPVASPEVAPPADDSALIAQLRHWQRPAWLRVPGWLKTSSWFRAPVAQRLSARIAALRRHAWFPTRRDLTLGVAVALIAGFAGWSIGAKRWAKPVKSRVSAAGIASKPAFKRHVARSHSEGPSVVRAAQAPGARARTAVPRKPLAAVATPQSKNQAHRAPLPAKVKVKVKSPVRLAHTKGSKPHQQALHDAKPKPIKN